MEEFLTQPDKGRNTGLFARVYAIVEKIPPGQVMTYGQIAFLLGNVRLARRVGQAVCGAPEAKKLPCHRVIKAGGVLPPAYLFGGAQRAMLEAEGVTFLPDGQVDMERHGAKV